MSSKAELTQEIARLSGEVANIQLQLAQLTARVAAFDEFELVDSSSVSEPRGTPVAKSSFGLQSTPYRPSSSAGQHPGHSELEREEAARQTGLFFLRCTRGEPRGDSGRSRIRLQNRVYIVVKDRFGSLYTEPIRAFHDFASVKPLVRDPRTGSFGDSIFAGFHEEWEARVAVQAAGFGWPHPADWN